MVHSNCRLSHKAGFTGKPTRWTLSASRMAFVWAAMAFLPSAALVAEDAPWNQFRGPRGDGTSLSTKLPVTFGEGSPEITWKVPVAGRAWSSPVIWGNQVWLTNAPQLQNLDEGQEKLEKPVRLSVVCLDLASGAVLHDVVLFEVYSPQFVHPTNSYASPTPYIEAGRVYVHFGSNGTACLDTSTGDVLWKRNDLPCDHFRGAGSSPVVYGDLLYLTMDGFDYQYLAALDKKTGATVWKKDRDVDFGTLDGDHRKAYSTPSLFEIDGRKQLVSPFASATIAYDPLTGETIWKVTHGGMNAASRPLMGNGLVYLSAADGKDPLVAVRPNGLGDLTEQIAWRTGKGTPKRPSFLLADDLLFFINDSSVASCLDAKTGEALWTTRLGGDYWASPILANGLIHGVSQSGSVPVFKAAREFELVGESKLEGFFNASPAVAGDALILRSETHLYRIDRKDK